MNRIVGLKTPYLFSGMKKNILGAEEGKVVTRFAPEPSGYLHIGHVKSALISYHFAKMFNGKMILRFDDTNPTKEREEFTDAIQEDLQKLEILWDRISFTSDNFPLLVEVATHAIRNNLAYCDDTPEDVMKMQRTAGIPSKCRDFDIETNLSIWAEMQKGNLKQFCLRAKIDFANLNKCLRDPVIFRHLNASHERTGDKFKVFPTYDFACPVVDAVEGVTHAMRSNEYADRNPQYAWFLKNLGMRSIEIYDFSRLNFVSTTLSKRKLNWFIEKKLVDGWDDPRFPTVRGILRRGMQQSALIEFILEQGPSKNANLMEWDKIWATNRTHVDPLALRVTAISKAGIAEIILENFQGPDEISLIPFHAKNEGLGFKPLTLTKSVLVEVADLDGMSVGDKILLMKLGVCTVTSISSDFRKASVIWNKNDKNFKDPKKITWLPNKKELLCEANVVEYGHLLNCKSPDEEIDFTLSVNYDSKFVSEFLAEGILKTLPSRTTVQFERRGFFVIDRKMTVAGSEIIDMVSIPDGRTKSMSRLSSKIDSKRIVKGG